MRIILLLVIITFIGVHGKNNLVKSLTESLGQEIIEIGAPIKDLPPDIEEEPSAEVEYDEKTTRTSTLFTTTKKVKETVKTSISPATAISPKILRDISKEDQKRDEEEDRIEKELGEIYKDNADYKGDSSEITTEREVTSLNDIKIEEKPIGRSRNDFKFQPDLNNKADVERFRTSVDEISCNRRITKLSGDPTPDPGNLAPKLTVNVTLGSVMAAILFFS